MLNHRYLSLLLLLLSPLPIAAQTDNPDWLAYRITAVSGESKSPLMLYDPHSNEIKVIPGNVGVALFPFSSTGQLAYSRLNQEDAEVYSFNTRSPEMSPINISHNPNANDYPLEWSPDSHYLAFKSSNRDMTSIKVWNGTTTIDISPANLNDTVRYFDVSWSTGHKLAFTADYPYDGNIYLWDGKTTTLLSQNLSRSTPYPAWSTDGRLAFSLDHDGEQDIFVWDGVSFKNSLADRDSFTNVAPELTEWFSHPRWNENGDLEFLGWKPNDTQARIFVWDGEKATNTNRNMRSDGAFLNWSPNGRWATVTTDPFSMQSQVKVIDTKNNTVLNVKGHVSSWSPNSNLAICRINAGGWILSVWDGTTLTEVAEGQVISAQWQGGSDLNCFSG